MVIFVGECGLYVYVYVQANTSLYPRQLKIVTLNQPIRNGYITQLLKVSLFPFGF